MKKKYKKAPKKEEIAEDWCFICKDGGLLLVCDYKQCLKAYHTVCVEKDDSFLKTGNRWTCSCHSCFICDKSSSFQCYVCPRAVCRRCISLAEFAHVRGNKGFCNNCLKLALLVEENKDVDSDGDGVDFKDRETYEGLFKEYWDIIKENEGLTAESLHSAKSQLQKGKKYMSASDSDEVGKDEENELVSDYDEMDDMEEHKREHKRKIYKGQKSAMKNKVRSNKKEFIDWGSKSLIQFLASIGKDTSKKLSQYDVTSIINEYIKENKLFHPEKKRMITCDARLQSVLGRKTVNRHRIYDLLEDHFAENQDESEEDEIEYNSDDKNENVMVPCKRQRKSDTEGKPQKKEVVFNVPKLSFASIVSENIKLVYLKRSLVKELLKQPESLESKVLGSFVRVKADPNDYSQRSSHQLVQVTGIKKTSIGENNTEILLQVSDMLKDISISMLSDDNFSEEECEDLRQRVKRGMLKKLTIVELEHKARSLHKDITKHWITRELALLQNLIDRANEKGWRRELFEYMERRKQLQTSSEQSRLLQHVPTIIPDVTELEPISDDIVDDKQGDEGSPKSILKGSSQIPCDKLEGNGTSSVAEGKNHHSHVFIAQEQHHTKAFASKELLQQCHILTPEDQSKFIPQNETHPSGYCIASAEENHRIDVKQVAAKGQTVLLVESSSDDGDDKSNVSNWKPKLEDPESSEWHCLGPNAERKGPYSLSFLKRWSDTSPFASKFKVWKTNQNEKNAIPLSDAIKLFPIG